MNFGSVCSVKASMGRPAIDLMGQRFGRLTVTARVENDRRVDRPTWRCVCDCGQEINLYGGALRGGRNKSCGCLRRDRAGNLRLKHGLSKTPPYMMFYDARKRAQKFGLPFDIEPSDIQIPTHCPVLGIQMNSDARDSTASLDRFLPEAGYTKGNIRVISFRANRLKSDASVAEIRMVLEYMEGLR